MTAPDWWVEGIQVVGLRGERGELARDGEGNWVVNIESSYEMFVNPQPSYWHRRPIRCIGQQQLRRILYESDRAYVASCGRSAQTEWISLPESTRTGGPMPRCFPLATDDDSTIRRLLEQAVSEVLKPYVSPL